MDMITPPTADRFDRAMKPFALSMGMASPLWLAYGAAAGVGATWWWMSRLSRLAAPNFTIPTALFQPADAAVAAPEPMTVEAEAPLEMVAEAEPVTPAPEPMVAAAEAPPAYAAPEPILAERPDELTLLRGVGPRVADALVARGVTTFAQLATWTEEELAAFDAELKLLGRSKRYDFIGQARALATTA